MRWTLRDSTKALLTGAAVAALAGCGSQAATSSPDGSNPGHQAAQNNTSQASAPGAGVTPAPGPANPVTIVRQAGATPAPGAVYGSTWASGLTADGSFSKPYNDTWDYEGVTVYTMTSGITGAQAAAEVGAATSDSQMVITGRDFYMFVSPVSSGSAPAWPVSPATIALRVHGTVQAPSSGT